MPSHYILPGIDIINFAQILLQHGTDGVLLTNGAGVVVAMNKSYSRLFDIPHTDVLGRNVQDLVAEGAWSPSLFERVVQQRKSLTVIQTTRKGTAILSSGTPIFDKQGEISHVLFNDRDMSLQSLLERDLSSPVDSSLVEVALNASEQPDGQPDAETWDRFDGIVVKSRIMKEQLHLAMRVAKYPVPVLLTGESGVGKSMVARFIHDQSPQRLGPFVAINCGAIPEQLVESELFGHKEGAFTGARAGGKVGRIETADGGTLFLDEIGELPYELQVKLLQFLETKQIYPVGSTKPIPVECTIVAATNTALSTMISNKTFREDLYYRLNGIPILLPPLRERREEIPPLAQYFLDHYSSRFGVDASISADGYEALSHLHFKGNIRELSHLIQRLIIITDGGEITAQHVRSWSEDSIQAKTTPDQNCFSGTLAEQVKQFERQIIAKAVNHYGSQEKAAKVLGVHQSTLSRKLENHAFMHKPCRNA
ncbi:MAG: AAA family ATPase [Proteobacteria bacterium]|nr:MAG: AAA family ATPase [Pseudomonadota bacterium]